MLSLGNTYSEGEVQDFYERVRKALNEDFELVCELKYDGTSISLTYENGLLYGKYFVLLIIIVNLIYKTNKQTHGQSIR
jgi:hypothetical protein